MNNCVLIETYCTKQRQLMDNLIPTLSIMTVWHSKTAFYKEISISRPDHVGALQTTHIRGLKRYT